MLDLIRRLLKRPRRVSAQEMLDDLRRKGAKIGENVHVFSPSTTIIDATTPYMLAIGDYVNITAGVKILTHDYAWSVLKGYSSDMVQPGAVLGAISPVEIGSHVFIGMNTVITRGVKIGDRVIIGAGSVVTRDCESNSVYAGNPARKICTLEEYYHKRKALQFAEARNIALHYRERMGENPPMEVFNEYFQLFATRQQAEANPAFQVQMTRMGSLAQTQAYMDEQPPMFEGFEAFLAACYAEDPAM